MENASKALIIVGAILVSILIIAIGMYIYSSSTGSIESAISGMEVHEIDSFNKNWSTYEGKQSGSQIKTLLSKLSANAQTYEEEPEKIIQADCNATNGGMEALYEGDNKIEKYRRNLNKAYAEIQSKHTYYVVLDYQGTALIRKIHICYNKTEAGNIIDTLGGAPAPVGP